MKSTQVIGFIGVGVMGEPICRHIIKKSGHKVLVCDRQTDPLNRLSQHGGVISNLEKIGAEADVIILSLPSGEIMENVICGHDETSGLISNLSPGKVIIDLSTSSLEITRRVSDMVEARGAQFVDAPVTRGREAAEEGRLAVLVGAHDEIFREILPLLKTFSTEVMHCGEPGCGQIAKILNNSVLYQTVLALGEAAAIGRKSGIDPEKLFKAFAAGSADSYALRNHGMKAILPEDYPDKAFPVTYVKKDVQYAVDMGLRAGIDAIGSRAVVNYCNGAINLGLGEKYGPAICAVFDHQEEAGVTFPQPESR